MLTYEERRRMPEYAQMLRDSWRHLSPEQRKNLEVIIIQMADNRKRIHEMLKPTEMLA